jgi:dinuclear metal center YbgI/SA1388 family protein
MARLSELIQYTDELLQTGSTPDYPVALNGLQIENGGEVRGIAAAVDFSTRAIEGTIAAGASLLVVHHGMFWGGFGPITGAFYKRLRLLIDNDIAVYSSHLPLDRHPALGNNVLLAKELGLAPSGSFANYDGIFIGVSGDSNVETTALVDRARKFAGQYDTEVRVSRTEPGRRTTHWAMCTGAGASTDTMKEAIKMGADTLIVGEGPHWTAIQAEESDLTIIYAGHYATETLGVRALAEHLGKKYNVPSTFVRAPTGL